MGTPLDSPAPCDERSTTSALQQVSRGPHPYGSPIGRYRPTSAKTENVVPSWIYLSVYYSTHRESRLSLPSSSHRTQNGDDTPDRTGQRMTDYSSTLDTIRTLYVSNRANEVLSLAESSWSDYTSCADVGTAEAILLGEAMRIASIAARGNGDPAGAAVWLSRARALFARGGSDTGIALTMLVDVYDALDRHGPGSTALAMLSAAEWAVGKAPEPMLREDVLALVAEKRAFVLLEQAGRGRDTAGLDAAGASIRGR